MDPLASMYRELASHFAPDRGEEFDNGMTALDLSTPKAEAVVRAAIRFCAQNGTYAQHYEALMTACRALREEQA
jgi:hypothetical protein